MDMNLVFYFFTTLIYFQFLWEFSFGRISFWSMNDLNRVESRRPFFRSNYEVCQNCDYNQYFRCIGYYCGRGQRTYRAATSNRRRRPSRRVSYREHVSMSGKARNSPAYRLFSQSERKFNLGERFKPSPFSSGLSGRSTKPKADPFIYNAGNVVRQRALSGQYGNKPLFNFR